MEDLTKHTPIELNKLINDTKLTHDALKLEIINHTKDIDELERLINEKLIMLDSAEKYYIALIEEITKR